MGANRLHPYRLIKNMGVKLLCVLLRQPLFIFAQATNSL